MIQLCFSVYKTKGSRSYRSGRLVLACCRTQYRLLIFERINSFQKYKSRHFIPQSLKKQNLGIKLPQTHLHSMQQHARTKECLNESAMSWDWLKLLPRDHARSAVLRKILSCSTRVPERCWVTLFWEWAQRHREWAIERFLKRAWCVHFRNRYTKEGPETRNVRKMEDVLFCDQIISY